MTESCRCPNRPIALALLACWCLTFFSPNAHGDDAEPRVVAGTCLTSAPSLLRRERANKPWQVVAPTEKIYTRDLLVALPGDKAVIEPQPQSVSLTLWGTLPHQSHFPGLQSEVVLHDTKTFDLDFTLVCGRVVVRNNKSRGAVNVWLRLPHEGWQLTLPNPGDEVALDLYGRWLHGVPFNKEPRPDEAPVAALNLIVLKGQLELKTPFAEHRLSAPPGAALIQWDSTAGADKVPQHSEELPAWADPKAKPLADAPLAAGIVERLQKRLKDQSPDEALLDLLAASDRDSDTHRAALTREIVVLCQAALDDLPHVVDALADAKHPEMRESAVSGLRHWIGGAPGRDLQLYHVLMEHSRLSPGQAETVMFLLHSPFEAEQPETYEALMAYMQHHQLAVRELARWHLYRLAPAGADIKYDAAAPEAERTKAIEQWKKLIPSGKLPPKEKPKP
jgi:hypothetical protein